MDETILCPSPNWFLPSIMAVSTDGWLIYGGPNKTLCVLEPLKDVGIIATKEKYQAHVFFGGNSDKIIAVDISPEWSEKRYFLSGSLDGTVKQWSVDTVDKKVKIKDTHCHDVHKTEHEELVGIGYSNETIAISVGASNIVKWDLTSNITKVYSYFLRGFKPTCMACSQHTPLQVAVGTKQGVILLVDLNGKGKIVYKVRGQDDIVMNLSWCPQYEMIVKKSFKGNKSHLDKRLEAIRSEGEKETGALEESGIDKTLPEDSFDEPIVQEDDMFDIYKDHEPDEFGHKKYEPEDILMKVKKEKADDTDYLADCLKLKEEILRMKNKTDPSIESLVDALDKTHVEVGADIQSALTEVETASHLESAQSRSESSPSRPESSQSQPDSAEFQPESMQAVAASSVKCVKIDTNSEKSSHKLLLASVGRHGGVRIWSEAGKLVGSCSIPSPLKTSRASLSSFVTSVLWYKPDSIIVCDGRSQILEINPQMVDSKNKLEWRILHAKHKRGLYCVKTNAPRIQNESTDPAEDWSIWSVAQDRNIIRYNVKTKKVLAFHPTCGGSVYSVAPCPYDAGKIAVSVGDGAVRVLECSTLSQDETKLTRCRVTSYWQNVQGKVLTVAWHPTRENLLAYGTGESRVGLLQIGGKQELPARVMNNALSQGVYSLSWGEGMNLYASGGNKLVVYRADAISEDPEEIEITLEGQSWNICSVNWTPRGMLVGANNGAVALLTSHKPHNVIAAAFVFSKLIHSMDWHPQQTSSSSEDSPYKNLIAVTSLDKESIIYILEYGINETDGRPQLTTWKSLAGHSRAVFQTAWNPHRDELLLTSSMDATVRVWDISTGACVSVFGGHKLSSLGVCWVAAPQLPQHVLSGGGEFCLRLWDIYQHKPENYTDTTSKKQKPRKRVTKKAAKKGATEPGNESSSGEEQDNVAIQLDLTDKTAKPPKKFLLPIMFKQINDKHRLQAPRKMLQMFLQKVDHAGNKGDGTHNVTVAKTETVVHDKGDSTLIKEKGDLPTCISKVDEKDVTVSTSEQEIVDASAGTDNMAQTNETEKNNVEGEIELDYLKVFGSIKEVNEFLDLEMDSHMNVHNNLEACIMLLIFRGHIDTMIQFASEYDMLCPFLLSMAPCVSFKYWKDATQLYLAQIDRLVARNEESKIYENRFFGGPMYRKSAILLSMHDVVGAVEALCEGKLFKEAYILCRIRYMDSVAEDVLGKWAIELSKTGQITVAAVLHMATGNLSQAAQELAKSYRQDHLSLAAEIAKVAGRTTFADHVQRKANLSKPQEEEKTEDLLKELPSKIELLMKENTCVNLESDTLNGDNSTSDKLNGDTVTNE